MKKFLRNIYLDTQLETYTLELSQEQFNINWIDNHGTEGYINFVERSSKLRKFGKQSQKQRMWRYKLSDYP